MLLCKQRLCESRGGQFGWQLARVEGEMGYVSVRSARCQKKKGSYYSQASDWLDKAVSVAGKATPPPVLLYLRLFAPADILYRISCTHPIRHSPAPHGVRGAPQCEDDLLLHGEGAIQHTFVQVSLLRVNCLDPCLKEVRPPYSPDWL